MASKVLAIVVLLATVFASAHAHDWHLGRCPMLPAEPNFDVDKFLGKWYVMEQFSTSSSCLLLEYARVSETQLLVTKQRQFSVLDTVGIDHTNSYSGTLDMPYAHDLGKQRVKWPLNLAGKGNYIIFDTDYENYAGIYECQEITSLMHRRSAAILSRTPYIQQKYLNRIKGRLTSHKIDIDDFDKVSREGCRSREEADFNVHVDPDTFTRVVEGTQTGITDVATTIVKGIMELATTVTQASQDTLSTLQTTAQTAVAGDVTQPDILSAPPNTLNPAAENVDSGLQEENKNTNTNTLIERNEEAAEADGINKELVKEEYPNNGNENYNGENNGNNNGDGNIDGEVAIAIHARSNNIPETTKQTDTPTQSSPPKTTATTTTSTTATTTTTTTAPPKTTATTTTSAPPKTTTTPATTTTTSPNNNNNNNNNLNELFYEVDESLNNIDQDYELKFVPIGQQNNNNKNKQDKENSNNKQNTNNNSEKEQNVENTHYNVANADDVIPVDDTIRTVVMIDKK